MPPNIEGYTTRKRKGTRKVDPKIDLLSRKQKILKILDDLKHQPSLVFARSARDKAYRVRTINALFVIAGPKLWEQVSWAKPDLFIEWVDNLINDTPYRA